LVRAGLKEALTELCTDRPDCLEAEDAEQVRGIMSARVQLDLILLDLFMPGSDGFELVSEVCANTDAVPVVVVSASESVSDMNKALDCGASGFVSKTTAPEVMLHALRLVLAGGVYVPPAARIGATSDAADPPAAARVAFATGAPEPDTPAASPSPMEQLTPRQRQVLVLMCAGRSNKMIARDLGLSEFTVKAHVAAILRTLDVSNRLEAANMARKLGVHA
jgi:DNA-binding NarL/FixJ family response regulator